VNVRWRKLQNNVTSADRYQLKFAIVHFDCPVCHETNCTVPYIVPPQIVDRRISKKLLQYQMEYNDASDAG